MDHFAGLDVSVKETPCCAPIHAPSKRESADRRLRAKVRKAAERAENSSLKLTSEQRADILN